MSKLSEESLTILSQYFDKNFRLKRFTGEDYDPFDPKMLQLISRLRYREINYPGSIPLPTISYRVFGVSNAGWLILLANGAIHESELRRGRIRIPVRSSLDRLTKEIFGTRNSGKVVQV